MVHLRNLPRLKDWLNDWFNDQSFTCNLWQLFIDSLCLVWAASIQEPRYILMIITWCIYETYPDSNIDSTIASTINQLNVIEQSCSDLFHLYLYKYENVCLSVCVFVRVFLGNLESDLETLWHKVAFRPRMSSITIKFQKIYFRRVIALFFFFFFSFFIKILHKKLTEQRQKFTGNFFPKI